MYHLERIKFFRLKQNQGSKLRRMRSPASKAFTQKLIDQEFSLFYKSEAFSLFGRYTRDRKQFHLRRPMLFVYVIIHQQNIGFQDPSITREINRLEDSLYKEKKHIVNYTVYIAKEGQTMSKKTQEACDYVTYTKVGARSVVNINLFYETKPGSVYFLYSDTYSPNAYYRYAVSVLKELIA
jgi:hypothetical protein